MPSRRDSYRKRLVRRELRLPSGNHYNCSLFHRLPIVVDNRRAHFKSSQSLSRQIAYGSLQESS